MYPKKLTTLQRKKNKQIKQKLEKNNKKLICKNEKKLLANIEKYLPEDIVKLLYSYVNNNIKFNLSHYKEIFTKFIFDYNTINKLSLGTINKLSLIFECYTNYKYCTHDKTALTLKEMLHKIPLDKLQKYLYYGTPSKYFNIAFPDEPTIEQYISKNYSKNDISIKNDKVIQFIYKNYVFEVLDLISYFTTKANEWHAYHCNNKYLSNNRYLYHLNLINGVFSDEDFKKQKYNENICKEYEVITRKLVLSILYIFDKYANKS
jgi:hypothetical protein